MKILIFSQTWQSLMGANRSLIDIAVGLKSNQHDIRVFCSEDGELAKKLKSESVIVYIGKYNRCVYGSMHSFFIFGAFSYIHNFFCLKKIVKKLESWSPDIIYTNTTSIDIGFKLAKILQTPHVWHVREFGWEDHSLYYFPTKAYLYQKLSQSSLVVCISNSIANYYRNRITAKIEILFNPISDQKLTPKKINKKNHFTFLVPGSIKRGKGQLVALRAFKNLKNKSPNVSMIFLGPGNSLYISLLKLYIFFFQVKNVYFPGYQSYVKKFFLKADAVLICSKNEALGRVTLEAMMYGVPVIGRNTAGTKELIGEHNGIIFDGSFSDLANKMVLYMSDIRLRQKCVNNGIKYVNSFFIKKPYINKLEKLLFSLLK